MGATRLFNRDFVLLWQGQLVSQVGNQAFLVALMFWTMRATGSASLMGLLLMTAAIPAVLLGPLAGTFADRHSRRAIIIASDASRGIAFVALTALVLARPTATSTIVAALFVISAFGGIVNAAFMPAVAAAIPDLVPTTRLAAANSLNQISVQGSILVGQAAGGILFTVLGAPLLFLVDGLSFLLSAGAALFIRLPHTARAPEADFRAALAAYRSDTAEGFRYIWRWPGMRAFLFTGAGINFFFTPIFVLLPFYATLVLHRGPEWFGFLLAAISAGTVTGLVAAGSVRLAPRARGRLVASAIFCVPLALGSLGLIHQPAVALAVCIGLGMLLGTVNVFTLTLFQLATPGPLRGRVLALVLALSGAVTPLGMALGGIAGDLTGKNIPLIYLTCGGAAAVLTAAGLARPALRQFLAVEPAPPPAVEPTAAPAAGPTAVAGSDVSISQGAEGL